jgi:hypothetical protein
MRLAYPVLSALVAFYLGRMTAGSRQLPELAATLPGDESGFSRELDLRVQQRFPIGTSDGTLIAALSEQGFVPEWRERDHANSAVFVWRGLLCTKVVRVIWQADDRGALSKVGGDYQSRCDL